MTGVMAGMSAIQPPPPFGRPLLFKERWRGAPGWLQRRRIVILALFGALLPAAPALSQNGASELAKLEQNPLARFHRLQIEDNAQFGFGPEDDVLNFARIQPVVPFELNEDWSLITRAVVPIAHLPWPLPADGLSDIALQLFLSPARSGKLVWGAGPAFLFPTASEDVLGTGKWSAGPAAAAVYTDGPWVVGAIASNLWSFAGDERRAEVNAFSIRPILNYNLPDGWYLSSSPTIAATWSADRENRWLVPVGGGVGKVFTVGPQKVSAVLESYYHAVSPTAGPDWQMRLQITLLFPK